MSNNKIIFLTCLLTVFCLMAVSSVALSNNGSGQQGSAGSGQQGDSELENPLKADTFTELLVNIINWATGIASTVAVLMIVIAGFQYMLSGGDENKTKSAMNTIKWSLIGLVIILMSWGILKEVLSILSA